MTIKTIYRNYQYCIHLLFTTLLFALVVCGISTSIAVAASDGLALKTTIPTAADAVARELANPNSSLATLTFKNQYRWYTGDLPNADDQNNYTMLFQPVPGEKNGAFDWEGISALGDIGFDLSYGVSKKSGLLLAFGMLGTLPTATDEDVAGKQLRLGPKLLLAKFEKWGIYGIFPSHQWDVTGWSDEPFSTTQFQPILNFLLGDGWTAANLRVLSM